MHKLSFHYLALLIFLSLPILGNYKKLLVISSATIVFTTIGMEWLFTIKEEYAYITKRAILFQCISLVCLFLLVRSKEDYYWYAALTVISAGGSAILNLIYSRKLVNWRQSGRLEYKKHFKTNTAYIWNQCCIKYLYDNGYYNAGSDAGGSGYWCLYSGSED